MTVYTFQPNAATSADVHLSSSNANLNYGLRTTLRAGLEGAGDINKILLRFDEISTIPVGVLVLSATLTLVCADEASTTNFDVSIHKSLTQFFEGNSNGGTPGAGEDASTWSRKNWNGLVVWPGGNGGAPGTDYETTATATTSITAPGTFTWDVTADVQDWVNGDPNLGWWGVGAATTNSSKRFYSSDHALTANAPKLVVTTMETVVGSIAGTSTVAGSLSAPGYLRGLIAGLATATATIISNQNTSGFAIGTSTASAFLRARVYIQGNAFGDSTASADIKASYHSVGLAAGTSSHVAHLKGKFRMQGLAEGVGLLTATPSFQGQLRGAAFGTSEAIAVGYARARSVAAVIGCNPVPLFYITNGSVRPNGQLDILNFLGDKSGFFLKNYRPQIAPYKDGGRFSSSPQSQGRRLRSRVFDNAIDIVELAGHGFDQDALIEYQQDLIAFQEAAADYWTSEFSFSPYYLVARGARETKTRYAIIHMMSCPELENPYAQPFFDHTGAAFEALTVRIERGIWLSSPPGSSEECVAASGQREWTVSGWGTGV